MTPGIDSNPFREAVRSQEISRNVFGGSVGRSITGVHFDQGKSKSKKD
jgi:hypothetical protein|tara:strand:- start:1052 stop:1195 length:144 start_codon:yes stop_codon:yes gene_type:complete